MASLNGYIFKWTSRFWSNLRVFFYNHKTLFDILFSIAYSLEQVSLFFFIIKFKEYSSIIVGVFIVIFLFTLNFERICMESRYSDYRENFTTMKVEYSKIQELNSELRSVIKSLINK